MKMLYLITLLIVSIIMISSVAQEINQTATDQEELKTYIKEAEKIEDYDTAMV